MGIIKLTKRIRRKKLFIFCWSKNVDLIWIKAYFTRKKLSSVFEHRWNKHEIVRYAYSLMNGQNFHLLKPMTRLVYCSVTIFFLYLI